MGQWYDDFEQTSDEEVADLLAASGGGPRAVRPVGGFDDEVGIAAGGITLAGRLRVPEGAVGLVLFAHGSGSSRNSPRNRQMAAMLESWGLGSLLFDLLTAEEGADRDRRFDVELLGHRLTTATGWVQTRPEVSALPLGYFGASTGAAAALWAAGGPGSVARAVVSRGGRPDLAGPRLDAVRCPTLLIVGGADEAVLGLNRVAASHLHCPHRLAVVPGATHLFEEPGALEQVATLAGGWFVQHLPNASSSPASDPLAERRPGPGAALRRRTFEI